MSRVQPFPSNDLPSAHGVEGTLAHAVEVARETFPLDGLTELLQNLLAVTTWDAGATFQRTVLQHSPPELSVRLATRHVEVTLSCEPELVAFALTRLLDRPLRVMQLSTAPSPALVGAWHALVVEAARRLTTGEPPTLAAGPGHDSQAAALIDAWLRLDGRSFRLELAVRARDLPPRRENTDVPVRFELVAGCAVLSAEQVSSLRLGDVLLPGAGWLCPTDVRSTVVAVPAAQESGFRLQVSGDLRYVAREQLPLDREVTAVEDATKESVIAELPIVVRLEVGSVTMTVRECLALRPGDVVSCGVPPGDRVVLRTAGREVARGELVTVDGEVGVRITDVAQGTNDTSPGSPPLEEG